MPSMRSDSCLSVQFIRVNSVTRVSDQSLHGPGLLYPELKYLGPLLRLVDILVEVGR